MQSPKVKRGFLSETIRGLSGFARLFGALAIAVAASNSAEAQVVADPPALLNTNGTSDVGNDGVMDVASDGVGNWVAVWSSLENLGGTAGTDSDIFVAASTDGGATWTPPALLNTNGVSDGISRDFFPQVATDGAGSWVAVWQTLENFAADEELYVSRSANNGATWTTPALLDSGGASDARWDDHPQITTDGAGNWVAVWRSFENSVTDSDIFVSSSTNNGSTWTAPTLLNTNGASDAGEDLIPDVTTDGVGNWVAVWQSDENLNGTAGVDKDIFSATSTNNGATWTTPTLVNTNGASDTGPDFRPQVTTDGAGTWVAAWDSQEDLNSTADSDWDIFVATSKNNGATWTAPALLNTNGASDEGVDAFPRVTTDGAGEWVALWQSTDKLGNTVDVDVDVFVAISTNDGATWTPPALLNTNGASDVGGDHFPIAITDGGGYWVAVWTSAENLGGTAGLDFDNFTTAFTIAAVPPVPAGAPYTLAALALVLASVGAWLVLKRRVNEN